MAPVRLTSPTLTSSKTWDMNNTEEKAGNTNTWDRKKKFEQFPGDSVVASKNEGKKVEEPKKQNEQPQSGLNTDSRRREQHVSSRYGVETPLDEDTDEGPDQVTVTKNHRTIINRFDANWSLPIPASPSQYTLDVQEQVHDFLCADPVLSKSSAYLYNIGEDECTILHEIIRPRNDFAFGARRILFWWVMMEHKVQSGEERDSIPLYMMENDREETILCEAITRAEKPRCRYPAFYRDFLKFFAQTFPAEAAALLNDNVKSSNIHSLLRLVKGACAPVFQFLSPETVLDCDTNNNTVLHVASEYDFFENVEVEVRGSLKTDLALQAVETLVKICRDSLERRNKDLESPYQHRLVTYGVLQTNAEDDQKINRIPVTDSVSRFFIDQYMRFDDSDTTVKYLYGEFQAREIHLDLSALPAEVNAEDLEHLFHEIPFETQLQYVIIPNCKITLEDEKYKKRIGEIEVQKGKGREDFGAIFRLLRTIGVTKIIKLIVDDTQEPSHHDDAIISCVKDFDVEEWEWNKADLCTDVIYEAAPNARKISLYSNGNNAVLRSWAAADGVLRFPKLEEVHLTIKQKLESRETTLKYMNAFRKNIESQAKDIPVTCRCESLEGSNLAYGTRSHPRAGEEIHSWLKDIRYFATFIRNGPDSLTPIKVAIIDDGINKLAGDQALTHITGASFDRNGYRKQWFFSSTGHGTLMAKLVRAVSPRCHLRIARLDETHSHDGVAQPTIASATKAILWAIGQNVDIISMSWTLAKDISEEERLAFQNAVDEAHRKNILMFGAAMDLGRNTRNSSYPAKDLAPIICIGGAGLHGEDDQAAGEEPDFTFPKGNLGNLAVRTANGEEETGSSIATALATGLAALVLHCAEISDVKVTREQLRKKEMMCKVFKRMTTDELLQRQSKYVAAQSFFEARFASLDPDGDGIDELTKVLEKLLN